MKKFILISILSILILSCARVVHYSYLDDKEIFKIETHTTDDRFCYVYFYDKDKKQGYVLINKEYKHLIKLNYEK